MRIMRGGLADAKEAGDFKIPGQLAFASRLIWDANRRLIGRKD